MTITPHSAVVIAPQARWDQVRTFWLSQGYELGDGVPLSASGNDPATHRGAHMWLTESQARVFTLRRRPQNYVNGYTFGQATACMAQFKARANGANINHGATPDASRNSVISLNTSSSLQSRAHFDQVAVDSGVQVIEGNGVQEFANVSEGRRQRQ